MPLHINKLDDFVKRSFDIAVASIGLIALFPLLCYLVVRIRQEDGGPILYRGVRAGRSGTPFRIFKFRTMIVDAEKKGPSSTADDDVRLTCIGKWLRRYKMDELPQLINVVKGEMSIVGPRPQVVWAVAQYRGEEKEILAVRPGITDWASVKFYNEGDILKGSSDPDKTYMEKIHPEKMRLAIEYAKKRNFFKDLKIIWDTLRTLCITR
ncbi:MAG: sugar transferase [bacterium]|nr:sugar transferase [bacterium]